MCPAVKESESGHRGWVTSRRATPPGVRNLPEEEAEEPPEGDQGCQPREAQWINNGIIGNKSVTGSSAGGWVIKLEKPIAAHLVKREDNDSWRKCIPGLRPFDRNDSWRGASTRANSRNRPL
ncbi:unnamed protein product [Nesidiocoris tenuis]|uniref:Uncharacterized protein n=1 Tax=Nesidiocoris tenuis TaxID=355587 RepID=A0A6H5G292_9HEMI|nr:unnamed protein product [Nesidiocoris tenuis]